MEYNKSMSLLLAGFGGQGILFAGKVIAYTGLLEEKNVSWLPSYGPEMRGGTCNCSVRFSEDPIGSPLVLEPNVLIAMNKPSLEKFINNIEPGGMVIYDSSLIDTKVTRDDIDVFPVDATRIAEDNGVKGLANIILVGKLLKESGFSTVENVDAGIVHSVPASKPQMVDFNRKALQLGMNS